MRKKKVSSARRQQAKKLQTEVGQVRDVNSRTIFKNPVLVSQFLRDNLDIPILKNVKPEDIEDVTERYQAYLGISFETDTVKRIRLRGEGADSQLYLISLIEHKSTVDYNVAMQLLRYMVCIWNEYAKEAERHQKGISRTKGFRYPAILPVVYYEGNQNWTADLRLRDRIMMTDILGQYVPDFTYQVIRIHDYTNEELLDRKDEMSLLMMINKVQTAEDMTRFLQSEQNKIAEIVSKAPSHMLDIIAATIWSLCIKMNMPVDDAKECVKKVKDRDMGYLFENMEKMDIQAERKKTAEAERKAALAEQKAKSAEQKVARELKAAKVAQAKAAQEIKELKEKNEQQLESAIKNYIQLCCQFHMEKDGAKSLLMGKYHLNKSAAEDKIRKYWENS